jgi:hypothetical protein
MSRSSFFDHFDPVATMYAHMADGCAGPQCFLGPVSGQPIMLMRMMVVPIPMEQTPQVFSPMLQLVPMPMQMQPQVLAQMQQMPQMVLPIQHQVLQQQQQQHRRSSCKTSAHMPAFEALAEDVRESMPTWRSQLEGGKALESTDLSRICENFRALAFDEYGCRVAQAALNSLEIGTESKAAMAESLSGHVTFAASHKYANRVIECLIECCCEPASESSADAQAQAHAHAQVQAQAKAQLHLNLVSFIVSEFESSPEGSQIASNIFGCRIFQRLAKHANYDLREGKRGAKKFLDEVLKNSLELAKNKYGGPCLQYILERGCPEQQARIGNALEGELEDVAGTEYGSFVVKKALACKEVSEDVARELLQDQQSFARLAKHCFGRHVVNELRKLFPEQFDDLPQSVQDIVTSSRDKVRKNYRQSQKTARTN